MSGVDMSMANGDIATIDFFNIENFKSGTHANNVNDRINTSNFMKFNVINTDIMNLGFYFGQDMKHCECSCANTIW